MIPTPGRIVEYTLSEANAKTINRLRNEVRRFAQMKVNTLQGAEAPTDGVMRYDGNPVQAGQSYPLLITRVWDCGRATEGSAVNGQVMLDGNDTLWVTSVTQQTEDSEGRRHGSWREYKRASVNTDLKVDRSEPGADDLRKAALETLQRIAGNSNSSPSERMQAAALLLAEAEKRDDAGKSPACHDNCTGECIRGEKSVAVESRERLAEHAIALNAQLSLIDKAHAALDKAFTPGIDDQHARAIRRQINRTLQCFHDDLANGIIQ